MISVIVGEGGSGGALALGVADRVWIMENACYSVVSPEGCASILWKDAKRADEAAEALHITAESMEKLGVVERVISEQRDQSEIYEDMKNQLETEIKILKKTDTDTLLQQRYKRFRAY